MTLSRPFFVLDGKNISNDVRKSGSPLPGGRVSLPCSLPPHIWYRCLAHFMHLPWHESTPSANRTGLARSSTTSQRLTDLIFWLPGMAANFCSRIDGLWYSRRYEGKPPKEAERPLEYWLRSKKPSSDREVFSRRGWGVPSGSGSGDWNEELMLMADCEKSESTELLL